MRSLAAEPPTTKKGKGGALLDPAATTVLLACSRGELRPDHLDAIASARSRVQDWHALWSMAGVHGVSYLVGRHLQSLAERRVDRSSSTLVLADAFMKEMRDDLWHETAASAILADYQLRIAAELERLAIRCVWLKGLALSQQLYGRIDGRQCRDLDLLVSPADLERVDCCLEKLGLERYQAALPGLEFNPRGSHHRVWIAQAAPDWQIAVEVHGALSGPLECQPDVDEILAHARGVDFLGRRIQVPAYEDELVILCLHTHQHNFALLRYLTDVGEYVLKFQDAIDWTRWQAVLTRHGLRGRTGAAFMVAESALGYAWPAKISPHLPGLTWLQRKVVGRVSEASILERGGKENRRLRTQMVLLMDRWRDMARLARFRLLPPPAYVRALCPKPIARVPGLARIYYWFRMARRMMKGADA